MRISRVIIKNFRSFCDQGIEISLGVEEFPIAIVGHNNSGKSNFLLAIQYCLGYRNALPSAFSASDFYFTDTTREIFIQVELDTPLQSSDAFNQIKEMPIFQLKVSCSDGQMNVQHYCCDSNGKPVHNAKAVKRSANKEYSDGERSTLNAKLKDGVEYAYKHKDKIPLVLIDPLHLSDALKVNRNTLLGKVVSALKADFERKDNVVLERDGIRKQHVGQPRSDIFEQALSYLENNIIRSPDLENLIECVESIIKAQLDVECKDFKFHFGFPDVSVFYDNLKFYITDNPDKPKIPVTNMGNGFLSLFIVALFRAVLKTDAGGAIIILEEPETFLHEHFQEYFYQTLCRLSEKNQVIYSTHSKKFVNLFETDSIIRFACSSFVKTEAIHRLDQAVSIPEQIGDFEIKNPNDFPKYMRTLEPNIGNLIFASKVLIVEGPHDLLGYTLAIGQKIKLGLNNIAILCSWGKDPICTMVQLCKKFRIPYFVVHDWDLDDYDIDVSLDPNDKNSCYGALGKVDKQQYTKNRSILLQAGIENVHANKRNLETVLAIERKGPISVFNLLQAKSFEEIVEEFPDFLSEGLLNFFGIKKQEAVLQ